MTESVNRVTAAGGRRHRILQVARRHLEQYGYRRTVIDDITREAGIAKGSFYLEFKGKDELVIAVIQEMHAEATALYEQRMAAATTPTAKIRTMLEMSFEIWRTQPLYRRLQEDDPEFHVLQQLIDLPGNREAGAEFTEGIRDILREGIASGDFRADLDLEITPYVLGSLAYLRTGAERVSLGLVSPQRLTDGLVDTFLRSIAA